MKKSCENEESRSEIAQEKLVKSIDENGKNFKKDAQKQQITLPSGLLQEEESINNGSDSDTKLDILIFKTKKKKNEIKTALDLREPLTNNTQIDSSNGNFTQTSHHAISTKFINLIQQNNNIKLNNTVNNLEIVSNNDENSSNKTNLIDEQTNETQILDKLQKVSQISSNRFSRKQNYENDQNQTKSRSRTRTRSGSLSESRSRTQSRINSRSSSRSRSHTASSISSRSRSRHRSASRSRSYSRSSSCSTHSRSKKRRSTNKKYKKNTKKRNRKKSRSYSSRSSNSRRSSRSSYSRSASRSKTKSSSSDRSSYRDRTTSRSSYNSASRSDSSRSRTSSYTRSLSSRSSRSRSRSISLSPKRKSYRSKKRSSYSRSRSASINRSRSRSTSKRKKQKYKRSKSPKLTSSARQRKTSNQSKSFYNNNYLNNNSTNNNINHKTGLNPTSALPFQNSFQFNKQTRDRYTYIRNPNQYQINRNKNSTFFINRNSNIAQNNHSLPHNLEQQQNSNQYHHQQNQQIQDISKNKSTILCHLNLNNKAREELEKRKLKAKQEKEAELERLRQLASSLVEEPDNQNKQISTDNTPAIPITSYSSYNNESDDDDDEDDNSGEEKPTKTETNKHKLDEGEVNSAKKQKINDELKLKKKFDEEDDEEEKSENNKTYLNVFLRLNKKGLNSTQSKGKTSVKKAPIIKVGQLAKDRIEDNLSTNSAKSLFIGPKLPYYTKQASNNGEQSNSVKTETSNDTKTKPEDNFADKEPNQETDQTGVDCNSHKINYSKDELAKYDNLLKMSQAYAKYNQVSVVNMGENGLGEISMVELDNTGLNLDKGLNKNQNLSGVNYMFDTNNISTIVNKLEDNQETVNSTELTSQITIEKPIELKINELEGLSVPHDVTLNVKPSELLSDRSAAIENDQLNDKSTLTSTQQIQSEIVQQQQIHTQNILLQHQQQHLGQQLQFIPIQNHGHHLIQLPAHTQTTQQLINLQLNPLIHSQAAFHLNPLNQLPTTFIQAPTSHLTNLAAFQQQQQLQQIQAVQQQQQQALSNIPIQIIPTGSQIIQLRPGFPIAQPQYIINPPFYRILPQ